MCGGGGTRSRFACKRLSWDWPAGPPPPKVATRGEQPSSWCKQEFAPHTHTLTEGAAECSDQAGEDTGRVKCVSFSEPQQRSDQRVARATFPRGQARSPDGVVRLLRAGGESPGPSAPHLPACFQAAPRRPADLSEPASETSAGRGGRPWRRKPSRSRSCSPPPAGPLSACPATPPPGAANCSPRPPPLPRLPCLERQTGVQKLNG